MPDWEKIKTPVGCLFVATVCIEMHWWLCLHKSHLCMCPSLQRITILACRIIIEFLLFFQYFVCYLSRLPITCCCFLIIWIEVSSIVCSLIPSPHITLFLRLASKRSSCDSPPSASRGVSSWDDRLWAHATGPVKLFLLNDMLKISPFYSLTLHSQGSVFHN